MNIENQIYNVKCFPRRKDKITFKGENIIIDTTHFIFQVPDLKRLEEIIDVKEHTHIIISTD